MRNLPKEAQLRQRLEKRAAELLDHARRMALMAVCEGNQDDREDEIAARAYKMAAEVVAQEAEGL